ncbi:MAG: glycosyltransferase [Sulfitobacter sp.]
MTPYWPSSLTEDLEAAFDKPFYLDANPDVAEAGVDPFQHYMFQGWKEGRDPNADFSTTDYAQSHDLEGTNPFVHWIEEGRATGLSGRANAPHSPDEGMDLTLPEMAPIRAAFDADFYLAANPDVAEAGLDPFTHFMMYGWQENRDPSPEFSTRYYLVANEDIAAAKINPFTHFILHGRGEGRRCHPSGPSHVTGEDYATKELNLDAASLAELNAHFSADYYLAQNEDVAASGAEPLNHFLTVGWREGRNPSADFDVAYYLTHNPELVTEQTNPLVHWLQFGRHEGQQIRPSSSTDGLSAGDLKQLRSAFSEEFYLETNPDVAAAAVDPFEHYMEQGWREGRDPSPDFSTAHYLSEYPDIASSGANPFVHFTLHGNVEKRSGLPTDRYASARDFLAKTLGTQEATYLKLRAFFDKAYYLETYDDVRDADVDPFLHFLIDGWREGRNPSANFQTNFYLSKNEDIASSASNPFIHWVLHGRAEGRAGCPVLSDPEALPELSDIDWDSCPPEDIKDISERFDEDFYLKTYTEVAEQGIDPRAHYLMLGWKKNYDPRPDFSTRYYRDRYIDIQTSQAIPFLHYCRNGFKEQRETQSYVDLRSKDFRPKVSIILPNYNHAKYLPQRIKSIADQTYDNVELIILDDKSSDDSQKVIRKTLADLGIEAQLAFNEVNSGNVFAQWRKGLSLATGSLIWICESDDFCEPDFLEKLVPSFMDESVNIAFSRIQFSDVDGNFMLGLDGYREGAEPGIWADTLTRPAAEWFNGAWGVNNVYANVGGGLFRNIDLPEEIWTEARSFKICGDWFLYLHILGAGQATFEPEAVAYFRQHDSNTSGQNFHNLYYYEENIRILRLLCEHWGIAEQTRLKFLEKVRAQYNHFNLSETLGDFDELFNVSELLTLSREKQHIQFGFLGFHPGGGELFPINLANAFVDAGHTVSMMSIDMRSINADMRARLSQRVAVYHASNMTARGRAQFLDATGVTVLNTHVAGADAFLYSLGDQPIERPYVVTLHGSYVGLEDAPKSVTDWILKNVNRWIYTADRNLEFFENKDVDRDRFIKLHNAMPRDNRPPSFTREDLGIAPTDTVFTLIARGIKRKGWRAAVEAFRALREEHGFTDVHLLMVGSGKEADNAEASAKGLSGIHFLGYQSTINGILRLSDCLILPSRFEGESYPLCMIQALQEHIPAIATDIGEVRSMMTGENKKPAGILLENHRNTRTFTNDLTAAMIKMLDPETRARFSARATQQALKYDINALVETYNETFQVAMHQFDED